MIIPFTHPHRFFKAIIIFFILLLLPRSVCAVNTKITTETVITISIHADGGEHKDKVQDMLNAFNIKHPEVRVELLPSRGVDNYYKIVDDWVKQGKGANIIWWFGGSRVDKYAQQGLIHDLTEFWQNNPNRHHFPKTILNTAKFREKFYAVPISTNLYTLYYRKSLFKKLDIQVPTTWDQMIKTCNSLNQKNISMFAIGTKTTPWVLHGWFDYLNLRLHGLAFYKSLLSGKHSFLDDRVRSTFEHLKELIDNKCFNKDHEQHSTWEVFPSILRGYSAMSLSHSLPEQVHFKNVDDIGIAEFPVINAAIPNYTVTPVDVFIVPTYTHLSSEVIKVLNFITTEAFQLAYVEAQQHIPAIKLSQPATDPSVKISSEIINASPGGIQYFDREMNIEFSGITPEILVDFINNPDIDATLNKLEQLRLKVFSKK